MSLFPNYAALQSINSALSPFTEKIILVRSGKFLKNGNFKITELSIKKPPNKSHWTQILEAIAGETLEEIWGWEKVISSAGSR